MRATRLLLAALLLAGCAGPVVRYERVPVPSTPYTLDKVEVSEAICREKGKTLRCETPISVCREKNGELDCQPPLTSAVDCWCDPR